MWECTGRRLPELKQSTSWTVFVGSFHFSFSEQQASPYASACQLRGATNGSLGLAQEDLGGHAPNSPYDAARLNMKCGIHCFTQFLNHLEENTILGQP